MNIKRRLSRALCRASVVYDFKSGLNKLCKQFPTVDKELVYEVNNKTDRAFAYVVEGNTLRIDVMGTSGENFEEKWAAWQRNYKMDADKNGIPEGAGSSARYIINDIGTTFDYDSYKLIDIIGHSAGSFIAAAIAAMLLKETKHCNFYTQCFAGPPDGNYRIQDLYNMNRDRWEQIKVINPRDIITMWYRDDDDKEERGIDIGQKIILPPDTTIQKFLYKWFKKFPSILEHSPKEYCDGMRIWCKDDYELVRYLKSIRKEMVN